jgi:hypothetical protein
VVYPIRYSQVTSINCILWGIAVAWQISSWQSSAWIPTLTEVEVTIGLRRIKMDQKWIHIESASLTQLRDLIIGNKPESNISGKTQDIKLYKQTPKEVRGFMLIGVSIIESVVKEASCYVTKTDCTGQKYSHSTLKTGSQSLAFMTGTGLDNLINFYNLDYNADLIRSGFRYRLHIRGTL